MGQPIGSGKEWTQLVRILSPVPTTQTLYLGLGLSCAQDKVVFQKDLSGSCYFQQVSEQLCCHGSLSVVGTGQGEATGRAPSLVWA